MTAYLALAIALSASTAGDFELCRGFPNKIEQDMRVLEADLNRTAAVEAATSLKDMIERGELDGESHFGALNRIKIIQGHMLLRQATRDRETFGVASAEARTSVTALCNWLGQEGFWYD